MPDQMLISQSLRETALPQTAGESFRDNHSLANGTFVFVSIDFGDFQPGPTQAIRYFLNVVAPDATLTSRTPLLSAPRDDQLVSNAGLVVAPDGGLSAYSYISSPQGDFTANITPIAPDGTLGDSVTFQPGFQPTNINTLIALPNGGILAATSPFEFSDPDAPRETRFEPFNADGSPAAPPAVLTGDDFLSLHRSAFLPLPDGRHIWFRPQDDEINIIGPGGFPGSSQSVFQISGGPARHASDDIRLLPFDDGRIGLLGFSGQYDEFGRRAGPLAATLQIMGPGGALQGDAVTMPQAGSDPILDATVRSDGSIAFLTGRARTLVQLHTVEADGSNLQSETVYFANATESGASAEQNPAMLLSAAFREDGGFVLTGPRAAEGGEALFVQNYSADGRLDGLRVTGFSSLSSQPFPSALYLQGDQLLINTSLPDADSSMFDGARGLARFDLINPRVLSAGNDAETLANPEAVDGGSGADTITGSDGIDRLIGGTGADLLSGGAGADLLRGDAGDDTLDGGASDDDTAFYQGEMRNYAITQSGPNGAVTVTGSSDSAADGSDLLIGIENLVFADRAVAVADVVVDVNAGYQGTEGNDRFLAGPGNNLLVGLGGNDNLNGGDGLDTLNGGAGNDTLIGGDSSRDLRDVIYGGNGEDLIRGGYGNDELRGDAGNDVIEGGFGADTVIGGDGLDVLTGAAFGDVLFGGEHHDFLNGGFGSDRLNGGGGEDRFFHLGVADHGSDWIQDFDTAEGDALVFGRAATRDQFQINTALTPDAGSNFSSESFVIYRPTGQILWALVDGAGQERITLIAGGEQFDLLA